MVKHLVNVGADIKFAVRLGAQNNHSEVVKYLVSKGVDITIGNNYALSSAMENNHFLGMVKYLVSVGADATVENNYAMKWAVKYGNSYMVKYLVSVGTAVKQ